MQPTWLKWELNTHVLATTPNRPVSRRRREHDGNVVSKSMRNVAQFLHTQRHNVSILSSLFAHTRELCYRRLDPTMNTRK